MTMASVISAATMSVARSATANTIIASPQRVVTVALCAIAAAILATGSIACASAALWIWGVPSLGAAGAPLAVAAVLLAACLAVLALMRHTLRSHRTAPAAAATPAQLLAEARHLFKDHKGSVLMAALIAGLEAGRDAR
jgi:hypothetical protein